MGSLLDAALEAIDSPTPWTAYHILTLFVLSLGQNIPTTHRQSQGNPFISSQKYCGIATIVAPSNVYTNGCFRLVRLFSSQIGASAADALLDHACSKDNIGH